jgi:cell division protein FtsI/penicillin-binding protein 2
VTRKVYRSPKKDVLSNGKKSSRKRSSKKAWSVFAWAKWVKNTKEFLAKALVKSNRKNPRKRLSKKTEPVALRSSKNNQKNQNSNLVVLSFLGKIIQNLVVKPLGIILVLAFRVFGLAKLNTAIANLGRIKQVAMVLTLIFSIVGIRLAFIQLPFFKNLNNSQAVLGVQSNKFADDTIIEAARGKIFIKDLAKNSTLMVAANRSVYKVVIYPKQIREALNMKKADGNPKLNLNEFISRVSAASNINYFSIQEKINDALNKYDKLGTRYYVLIKEANNAQFTAIQNLTSPPLDKQGDKLLFDSYRDYILAEPQNSRSYPEQTMLAATLGFNRENSNPEEAAKIDSCKEMVDQNAQRGTTSPEGYTIGQYGVERAFCSELAGVNGKISFSKNGLSQYTEVPAIQGSDIVLTIDKNIQTKAEEVLQKAVDANSNENGKPLSGTILVSEVATGKILARASYPFFDPNNVTNNDYETGAIKDQAAVSYDPGSVIKPLTISAARDVYEKGKVKSNGKRIGVPIDFQAEDVDEKGLVFTSTDGRDSVVRNADDRSFKGVQSSLSDILRNSINTLIARIQKDYLDNETTRYYFLEKFKLGDWSDSFLYTSEPPNTKNFDKDINSPFSYANMAFGQGFTTTPINLIRAYSAIANGGCMVEPRIVESVDNKAFRNNDTDCTQVIDPKVAGEVIHMLQNTLEVGFGNGDQTRPSKAKMDLYTGAAKTGTAQVARPLIRKDKEGKEYTTKCSYACNSNLGLFDHTFIGFAPASNPKIIVLVKLSQPKPGDRNYNYAEFSCAPFWKEITEYSLGYLGVRPDR